ncbi:class II glutamine amidotransferase [Desulfobacter curvatus]|uniref:class II glutamine amidotransferase n=1 Tax=Desulfobacter curvatus TaxID=2290 RepID=UPI00035EFAC6|nr:class II glutamine amidotransferase [Desulfobacter curvatus]
MCGIAGIISRGSDALASDLLDMLYCVRHRGMDATGVAVYEEPNGLVQLRATMVNASYLDKLESIIKQYATIEHSDSYQGKGIFTFYNASLIIKDTDILTLHQAINNEPALCVHSIGDSLRVFKDQGTSKNLRTCHTIRNRKSTHGIGHVRLATESAENINAAHPFVSPLAPQMSLVHNGQFTNYFNMRRFLERKGIRFKTRNDSEMAAQYIGWLIGDQGYSLEEALHLALENLDGIFTLLVSTPTRIGVVKDRLAIKPLLILERDDITLFGSEQISFTPIFEDAFAHEMEPGEVKVWSI